MNIAILVGRLTSDPELKYGQSGKAFAKFSLAVARTFNRNEVDFINCVAFGKTAELIAEYLRKGNKAGVQGEIRVSSYENSEGQKIRRTEIIVGNIEFLESKGTKDRYNDNQPSGAEVEKTSKPSDDDEFPF
ncbi:single-stranded DNA-binding protein [Haliovirga abyssi]|uniref:Single-stranded DNA-binding protein n=1 Tax=Haliovirga abyssi TaxID=2996794 RepID=A0AAU9DUG6_9FUSO|nr:single-stranded DNA-binding protein [Haliovirga abyssi]BDU49606.1 single-stranded DNA-binding protein [Haliovirga abyssi]